MTPSSTLSAGSARRGPGGPRPDALSHVVVWQTVRKHWSTALATALAVSLSVVFWTLGQTKIYQATASVQFDPTPPRPLGTKVDTVVDMGVGTYWNNQEYYETQYNIIQSRRVALGVVKELGLQNDVGFLRNLPPGKEAPPDSVPEDVAADTLRGRIKVDPVKNSRMAYIKLEDADPERAQRILTAVVDVYVAQNLDDALESTTSAVHWLRSQLDKLKVDLESSELSLHEYKKDKNILSVAFDDQSNMLREEMRQINEALTEVRTRREEVAARRAELAKVKAEDPTDLPASELLQSTLLQQLRQRYEDALRDREALIGAGKGPKHPEMEAAENKIESARKALLKEVRNVQGALDRDLAVIQRQEAGLSGLFERAKKQALDLNLLEIEYNRLKRSKENTERLYSLVMERTKESDLTRMLRVNNIRIIDRPTVPRSAVRPRVFLNVLAGSLVGVLLGVAAAMGRGLLDRSIKTPDDLEHEMGIPFLGLIPEIGSGGAASVYYGRRGGRARAPKGPVQQELIVHQHPTSGIAEASRAVRTNLMFMAPDNPFRTLLVTSAGPAEGKTTVACCIAIAMAQAGQRVVLIDCDLRRPRVHRIFRKSSDVGVTTALLDGSVDEAVLETEVPNMSVIPAGPIPPNPAELLHSERFKAFLERVTQRFDRVIIDSPPVVAVTDATILSTQVDGVAVVVRAFATRKDIARHALRSLRDVGAKVAGAVLNAVNLDRHEYKYSYYYYRREGYYASNERPSAAPPPSPTAPPH